VSKFTVGEVKKKCVAIVRFGPGGFPTDGMKAGEYYQVTIDPRCISPSGKFIRFGHSNGDEIMGWQRTEALTVEEILGPYDEKSDTPVLQYGDQQSVTMMLSELVKVE
jgi:hypothetical protein